MTQVVSIRKARLQGLDVRCCTRTRGGPVAAKDYGTLLGGKRDAKGGLHSPQDADNRKTSQTATSSDPGKGLRPTAPSIQDDFRMIRRLGRYLWPSHRHHTAAASSVSAASIKTRIITALGCLVLAKVCHVQVPILFKMMIDRLGACGTPAAETLAGTDVVHVAGALLAGYFCARTGTYVFSECRSYLFSKVSLESVRVLLAQVYERLLAGDVTRPERAASADTTNAAPVSGVGAISKSLDRGSKAVQFILNAVCFQLLPTLFEISLVTGIMAHQFGPVYAGMTVACMAIYATYTLGVTHYRAAYKRLLNASENETANRLHDTLSHVELVRMYAREADERDAYTARLAATERIQIKNQVSLSALNVGQAVILSAGLTGVMASGVHAMLAGGAAMGIGDLVMMNGLLFQLAIPLNNLGSVWRELRQSCVDVRALFALVDGAQGRSASPVAASEMCRFHVAPRLDGDVILDNVSFAHDTGAGPHAFVLRDVDLIVPPGRKVALTGHSGSGKSTLFRLLYGWVRPTRGSIWIGGHRLGSSDDDDDDAVRRHVRRCHVGGVPQSIQLFHKSILDNIAYGCTRAALGDASAHTGALVRRAAEAAHLHETLMNPHRFPRHYDTLVGTPGSTKTAAAPVATLLSGGERQRLAIARALLQSLCDSAAGARARLVLLDEWTSSLDVALERALVAELIGVAGGPALPEGRPHWRDHTVLVITHRLEAVCNSVHDTYVLDPSTGSLARQPAGSRDQ